MMTTDQRAELDAAMERATAGPWGADGLRDNRIVWSGPENRVCFMAIYPKAHADSLAIVALHNAYPLLTATIDAQAAEIARLREALAKSEDAMREMFRYYDGGETRGSYDGKPERAQLRTAWQIARAALASNGAA